MSWGGLHDFLAMGGYGFYVWGSYGVAALCVALELVLLSRRARRVSENEGTVRRSEQP